MDDPASSGIVFVPPTGQNSFETRRKKYPAAAAQEKKRKVLLFLSFTGLSTCHHTAGHTEKATQTKGSAYYARRARATGFLSSNATTRGRHSSKRHGIKRISVGTMRKEKKGEPPPLIFSWHRRRRLIRVQCDTPIHLDAGRPAGWPSYNRFSHFEAMMTMKETHLISNCRARSGDGGDSWGRSGCRRTRPKPRTDRRRNGCCWNGERRLRRQRLQPPASSAFVAGLFGRAARHRLRRRRKLRCRCRRRRLPTERSRMKGSLRCIQTGGVRRRMKDTRATRPDRGGRSCAAGGSSCRPMPGWWT